SLLDIPGPPYAPGARKARCRLVNIANDASLPDTRLASSRGASPPLGTKPVRMDLARSAVARRHRVLRDSDWLPVDSDPCAARLERPSHLLAPRRPGLAGAADRGLRQLVPQPRSPTRRLVMLAAERGHAHLRARTNAMDGELPVCLPARGPLPRPSRPL